MQILDNFSIELLPRTAEEITKLGAMLPQGTRIYLAHIDGTPFDDLVASAKRIREAGYAVMPHIPARLIKDRSEFETWLRRYREEADVNEALVIAGGVARPHGDFSSAIQLLETGYFDKFGFNRLHVAGHPEGNRDIDSKGGTAIVDNALQWKQAYVSNRTDCAMAIVTQFVFDAEPVIDWTERLRSLGITLPVHVGVAGPAKLSTLIKYGISCGVGPSLSVLRKRARDVSRMILPVEPGNLVSTVDDYKSYNPDSLIERIHIFPLGGFAASAKWVNQAMVRAA